jgi:curli biogenesis system outer membrane secretion channel CsgG
MVDKGKKVKTGKITGADCILLGDITIFGRDDKSEGNRVGGSTYGNVLRRVPLIGNKAGSLGQFKKKEKAVVAIALRICRCIAFVCLGFWARAHPVISPGTE